MTPESAHIASQDNAYTVIVYGAYANATDPTMYVDERYYDLETAVAELFNVSMETGSPFEIVTDTASSSIVHEMLADAPWVTIIVDDDDEGDHNMAIDLLLSFLNDECYWQA